MSSVAELSESRELFVNLTLRELRGKYKRSVLGWTWSLLNPLATMVIFTVVFRFFLKIEAPPSTATGLQNFALYLLCALLPWNFVLNSVNGSIGALVGNANLIKKTYFPRDLLVVSQVVSWLVSLLIELALLVVILLAFGNVTLLWLPMVLALVALLSIFVIGLGLAFSVMNVYFRDIQHFVGIFFQVWFYLTPIVYPLGFVPRQAMVGDVEVPVRALLHINPLVGFVESFRDCLYELRMPAAGNLAYITVVSVVTFVVGWKLFTRLEGRLAEEL